MSEGTENKKTDDGKGLDDADVQPIPDKATDTPQTRTVDDPEALRPAHSANIATWRELDDDELRSGLPRVGELAERVRPGFVAFLGLSSYRTATGERRAAVGLQERRVGGAPVWLLPNPSGLNASWQLPRLAEAYGELREAALRRR